MKVLLVSAAVILAALVGAHAEAAVINPLHLAFQSGAVFDGTVTFNDGYAGMLDASGSLRGGPYGLVDITWTWWAGTGQPNPWNDDGNPATYEDFLMDGVPPSYSTYIGLSWFYPVLGRAPLLDLGTFPYYRSAANDLLLVSDDFIVAGGFGEPVPEPGTLLLLGGGVVALALRLRRRS